MKHNQHNSLNLIKDWIEEKKFNNISVEITENVSKVKEEDYEVVHKIVLEPNSNKAMCVEIWITKDGAIAILIGKWSSFFARLDKEFNSDRCLGGHEPIFISIKAVYKVLEIVSGGHVWVQKKGIGLFGLHNFKIFVTKNDYNDLSRIGYKDLKIFNTGKINEGFMSYEAWT